MTVIVLFNFFCLFQNITSETLDALFEILDTQQSEETVSALVLAICGWLNGEVDRTMKCGYCQRQILFHNFFSIMDKSENQSVSEPQTSVSGDHPQNADRMEVSVDVSSVSESVTMNSHANNGQNIVKDEVHLENENKNFSLHSQDVVNSCDIAEEVTPNSLGINESELTVLPKSDAACTIGDPTGNVNATDVNDSESKTVTVGCKESCEESKNVLLEDSFQLNENTANKKSISIEKPLKKQSEEQSNEHLESQGNEVAKESGRMLNGGALDDGEVGLENVPDSQCSKKRKLEDDEDKEDSENVCADDQQNVKKLCLQKSHTVEKNGECQEDAEIVDKTVRNEPVASFNNCHNLVNERSASCKSETLAADRLKANSDESCRSSTAIDGKPDGSCEENEMSDTDGMFQISEAYSLAKPANSDNNSDSAVEDTPVIKLDTVHTKLNGDAPTFVSDSDQVPKLITLKDADDMNVSETDDIKGCSSGIENDENKELHEQVNSKPLECEMKIINDSESLDAVGNVNDTTPGCEAGKENASDENGVLKDSACAAVTDSCEMGEAESETVNRTSDCEKGDTIPGIANDSEGNCDRIEDSGSCCPGQVDDSNTTGRESCEMETESSSVGGETCKKSGKRKLEDCAVQDDFQSKRNKSADDVAPKKHFHPVEEHRYWCIWKLKTKDRGVQKEGWRQVLDYLKLSPRTPVEQPTVSLFFHLPSNVIYF